jgi:hypothetical protein
MTGENADDEDAPAEEAGSLDADEGDDGATGESDSGDGTGGFQFGAVGGDEGEEETAGDGTEDADGSDDADREHDAGDGTEDAAGTDATAAEAAGETLDLEDPDPDDDGGGPAEADAGDAEDGDDDPDDVDGETIELNDPDDPDDAGESAAPAMSPFASGPSETAVDADGATDEAVASALADVDVDRDRDDPGPSVGTDGGRGGAVAGEVGGVGPALGPGDAATTGIERPRVSTAVEDPGSVDARFVVACPACEYVAGDDALVPVATARAKHAAHAGADHVPRWHRTEGLVTPETFMTTEVRTVACEDCGTERWIADRATAREFASDHETYTTHEALEVTTRHVEAPSPEGLLAVVVALTDPPGGETDVGDDPVPGVAAAAVEAAFVDAAARAIEPDEDAGTLADRTARAVGWRIRRLREHGRLTVEEVPDPDGDGDRRLLRATDRGREVVESTIPDGGLGELSTGGN